MKILFINLPYSGHVVPTIGLVQKLIKHQCEVTYMLPFDWEDKVSESCAKFLGYDNHKQLSEQIKNAYLAAEQVIEKYDLIIYEQFFFLGKHLAEKYHKPVVRIFTAPATNEKLMKAFITSKGPMSIFKYSWITKAFTKDIVKKLGVTLKTDNWLDEIIHNPPKLNLVYTLREFQPYAEEFSENQYKFLGPSIYERKETAFDFVKGTKPVVYISLGTILKGSVSFYQHCIEAFRDENVDVILSVGKKFKINKIKNIPSNVHIYDYVPQLRVLKMADVFVTHGGMNSVSEALVYGTPMVVIPFVSDQPVNASCVERLGIGRRLEPADVNKETLKENVKDVLFSREIKENLKKISALMKEAPGNIGGAQMIIDLGGRNDE